MYYTLQEKTHLWLSLLDNNIPAEIIDKIWNNLLEIRKREHEKIAPPAPKKQLSERTLKLMENWRRNGQWIRHVRKIKFENLNERFLNRM
tara:strand:+ start:255 stop:524 length:270 start_codon:yes stop_codon:yes gene_type:complete